MNLHKSIITLMAFACVCLSSSGVPINPLTGPMINPANGHSYYLLSDATWTDSEAFALTLGGHLTTINDAAEQTWVYSSFSGFGGGSRTLWIGLNDVASEGNFVWANGEAVTYTNWYPGEPNDYFSAEDYGMIFEPADIYARSSFWNDADNVGTKYGAEGNLVINGVVEVVPEPSTFAFVGIGGLILGSRRSRK